MAENPFKPSAFESKGSASVGHDFDFYPSSVPFQSGTASGNIGAPLASTTQSFGFGENFDGAPQKPVLPSDPEEPGSTGAAILSHPVWTWKFWQSFFDVDSSEVLRRMFLSFAPYPRYLKSESIDVFIGTKPDLYGPFWISTTLVFLIAVLGNMASYFQYPGQSFHWKYNFHQVSAAAISVFMYVGLVPLILWTFLWWRNMHGSLKLSGAWCVYGYSMFLYIPVSFLWLIDIVWLQWLLALTAAALSGTILAYIFWNHLHFNHRKSAVVIGLIVLFLHLALGFGFVTYFFHYAHPDASQFVNNSTTTLSSIPAGILHNNTEQQHANFSNALSTTETRNATVFDTEILTVDHQSTTSLTTTALSSITTTPLVLANQVKPPTEVINGSVGLEKNETLRNMTEKVTKRVRKSTATLFGNGTADLTAEKLVGDHNPPMQVAGGGPGGAGGAMNIKNLEEKTRGNGTVGIEAVPVMSKQRGKGAVIASARPVNVHTESPIFPDGKEGSPSRMVGMGIGHEELRNDPVFLDKLANGSLPEDKSSTEHPLAAAVVEEDYHFYKGTNISGNDFVTPKTTGTRTAGLTKSKV